MNGGALPTEGEEMGERGFTLIEIMLSAVLVVVMSAAGYLFYEDTIRFQALHARQREMDTRLQIAMGLLVREIQHAGYGINNPMSTEGGCEKAFPSMKGIAFCPAIVPAAAQDGTDTLTLLRVDTSLGRLAAMADSGDDSITVALNPNLRKDHVIQVITIGGLATYAFGTSTVAIPDPTITTLTLNLGATIPSGQNYPAGFPVEAIVASPPVVPFGPALLTYAIGPNPNNPLQPALLRGGALIASGIEDLQVTLVERAGSIPGQITIQLMAQTPDPNPQWLGGQRPGLGNRAAAVNRDNFRRATLTRVVQLRNS
jgi:prepilin-type N-terminal cleavage/methylation domain-containing protein